MCQPTMRTWAADLAKDMRAWLAELLDLPLVTPHALLALQLPTSLGGLGSLHPQHEAALRFLQTTLPTVEELPVVDSGDDLVP